MRSWRSTVDTKVAVPCGGSCCFSGPRYLCPRHEGSHLGECSCVPLGLPGWEYREIEGEVRASETSLRLPTERPFAPRPSPVVRPVDEPKVEVPVGGKKLRKGFRYKK